MPPYRQYSCNSVLLFNSMVCHDRQTLQDNWALMKCESPFKKCKANVYCFKSFCNIWQRLKCSTSTTLPRTSCHVCLANGGLYLFCVCPKGARSTQTNLAFHFSAKGWVLLHSGVFRDSVTADFKTPINLSAFTKCMKSTTPTIVLIVFCYKLSCCL